MTHARAFHSISPRRSIPAPPALRGCRLLRLAHPESLSSRGPHADAPFPAPQGQSHGELDESRIVDGIAGDRAVYRRRAEQPPAPGAPQLKPKLLRFVIDCSGSMYYFNGHDRRLERTLQTVDHDL